MLIKPLDDKSFARRFYGHLTAIAGKIKPRLGKDSGQLNNSRQTLRRPNKIG